MYARRQVSIAISVSGFFVLLMMLILGIYYAALLAGLATMLIDGGGSIALVTYALGMPVGAVLLRWLHPAPMPALLARPSYRTVRAAVLLGLVAGIIPIGLLGLMDIVGWAQLDRQTASFATVIAGVVIPQILVALVEEFTFRATIQPLLTARLGMTSGLLTTSLLFGIFHLPNILFHDVPTPLVPLTLTSLTVMGIVFGWAFARFGSWWGVPTLMHFTWNTACFGLEDVFDFSYTGPAGFTGSTTWFPESGLLGLAGLAFLLILVYVLPHRCEQSGLPTHHDPNHTENNPIYRPDTSAGDER